MQIWDNNDINRAFATYNCDPIYRLNIRVNSGEMIHFGYSTDIQDVYFKLRAPNGTVVMGPTLVNSSSAGWISSCAKAIKGPSSLVGGGYSPLMHSATQTGDYYIEFAVQNNANTIQKRIITNFDVTVSSGITIKKGRLWSKAWDLQLNSFSNPLLASMYVYSKDSVVTKLNFNGIQPHGFVISCNSFGSTNVGSLLDRRKSDYRQNILNNGGIPGVPEYPIFLNNPDLIHFPTGSVGAIDSFNLASCTNGSNCITVYANKAGQVEVNLTFPNSPGRTFLEDVNLGSNCILWDGLDGNGLPLNVNDTVNVSLKYTTGMTHLPLLDVENHLNGYTVELVRPTTKPNGSALPNPAIFWDDSYLTDPANSLDGVTNTLGCLGGNCHKWQNRGTSNTNPEVINTWWYVNLEQVAFTIVCPVILGAEIQSFSGSHEGDKIKLIWETATEQNLDHFEIEKSMDAIVFHPVGLVVAENKPSGYSFLDEHIYREQQYYRLKYFDLGGNYNYSKVIMVKPPAISESFAWDHQSNSFSIKTRHLHELEYELIDLYGNVIFTAQSQTNHLIPVNVNQGFYILRYRIGGEQEYGTQKIIAR